MDVGGERAQTDVTVTLGVARGWCDVAEALMFKLYFYFHGAEQALLMLHCFQQSGYYMLLVALH